MAIEQQKWIDQNEQIIQKQKQELMQWIQNLANNEKDPTKKDLIPKMWEKTINEFQKESWYSLSKMWKKLSNWNTVLKETLSLMPKDYMQSMIWDLSPWYDKQYHNETIWFLKTELNKFWKIALQEK